MAEAREYISRPDELGNIHISEEVLAVIAAAAAMEVEGVKSLSANLSGDIAQLFTGKKAAAKGVRITLDETENVCVELSILIEYGCTIPDVARAVQESVATAIESTSGLRVACVNVHVGGVVFPPQAKQQA